MKRTPNFIEEQQREALNTFEYYYDRKMIDEEINEINSVISQTITNTLNHILESGLLEEKDVSGEFLCDLVYRMPPQDGDTVTHTHVDYSARKGHNTLARAVKEFMSNMDTNSVDSIHLNKQAN